MSKKRQGGRLPRISAAQFKSQINYQDGVVSYPNAAVIKSTPAEVVKAHADGRLVQLWTISTNAVDRDGDTISVDGWDLRNFRKGGSVLWAHGNDPTVGEVPIGKPTKTFVQDGKLKSEVEFTSQDLNPFGFMVWRLAEEGFVRGSSVGFRPIDFEPNTERDGFMPVDFSKQELLEFSITPVPSNPEALLEAKGHGIDLNPLQGWIEAIKDRDASVVMPPDLNEQDLELAYKCISRSTATVSVPGQSSEDLMNILEKQAKAIEDLEAQANEIVGDGVEAFEKVLAQVAEVQKRGRVLSSANESKLRKAQEMIDEVLSALGIDEPEPKDVEHVEEKTAAPEVETVADVVEDDVLVLDDEDEEGESLKAYGDNDDLKISEDDLADLDEFLRGEVLSQVKETLNRLNGSVD